MIISTLNEWLNESGGQEFLEPTEENLINFNLDPTKVTKNSDGSIDYDGSVFLTQKQLTKIPFNFNIVNESFYCNSNKLISLKGSPKIVKGEFRCNYNQLKTLKDGPTVVEGQYACNNNRLVTLNGSPRSVGGSFECFGNELISLEHGPEVVKGEYNCNSNFILSLYHFPINIGGKFSGENNLIMYNPLEIKGKNLFNIDVDRNLYNPHITPQWDTIKGLNILYTAFERLDELSPAEVRGIQTSSAIQYRSAILFCQEKIDNYFKKNSLRKELKEIDGDVLDMF